MDNVLFYQPPSALGSQRLSFPRTVTAPHLPRGSIASPARQTITTVASRSCKTHTSNLHCGNEKHKSTLSQNPPNHGDDDNHSDDDDFPDLEELLLGTRQKNLPARVDLSGDDYDGFIDIDDLPSDIEQKGAPSTGQESGGTVLDMDDNRIRSGSPVGSSGSTSGSSRDPIILGDSEDESAGESETDYGNLDADLKVSDSSSSHIADRNMADGEGFGSGITHISDRLIDNDDSGVVDGERLQLAADLPMTATPDRDSVTLQVCRIRASTEATEGSGSFQDLDVSKAAEDEGTDVFANDEADADTCSLSLSGSPAISPENPAPESDVALHKLQGSWLDPTKSPQPDPAMASLDQSDSDNDPRPSNRRRRNDTKRVRHERHLLQASTAPARSASPVSAVFESGDECAQPVAQLVAPQERGICDIEQEGVDVGGTDDSNDEDYSDTSDAVASKIRGARLRKRAKRAREREPSGVGDPSNQSPNLLYQDCTIAVTSSLNMQESQQIPISGFLTLKTIGSKVVYCLTFSQEPLPELSGTSQRHKTPGSVSAPLPVQELARSGPVRTRFSTEEDELLLQLKGEGLSWDEISEHFERSKGTLQVHYSTKLKPRSEKSNNTRKRLRSG